MYESESKSVVQMDTGATKVNDNEKYSIVNVSNVTEKTLDTSKKKGGEYGNIINSLLKFY